MVAAPILWRCREGVRCVSEVDEDVAVSFEGRHAVLRRMSQAHRMALKRLFDGGATEEVLAAVVAPEGAVSVAEWHCHARRLERLRAIEWVAADDAGSFGALIPVSSAFHGRMNPLDGDRRYALSSFTFVRRRGDRLVAESPLSHARVELWNRAAVILPALARAGTAEELAASAALPEAKALALMTLLHSAGMLGVADERGGCLSDNKAEELGWTLHDAVFHFRTRFGRHDEPYGAKTSSSPPPAQAFRIPSADRPRIRLATPDLAGLHATDLPFSAVMEARRSRREYDAEPITVDQLGEFVYRVAGIRGPDESACAGTALTRRPYPSGGACYPLELYVAVRRCRGLDEGLYRYDASAHALDSVSTITKPFATLLSAYQALGGVDKVQVLLLLTLRVSLVSQRYDAIAYSLAIKEVGILYQSMYLVATAMGLAPCAIGGGDSELFARAIGVDQLEEPLVGEFLLGSASEDVRMHR